uniref:TBC1 domain family member 2 n=1 Tax=Scleropages formosus TaxID=113540 RepID=A0A8C9TH85_SCLFO
MAEPGACPLQPDPHVLHESVAPVENPGEAGANGLGPSDWVRRGEEPHRAKLCGYLGKLGGPLKSWKCRWFVYEEKQCQLFYYRTAQDVNPLGRIELASATFGFSLQAEEAVFHIQTPERVFVLKAVSRDAMMYWLQQLQLKRWQHRDPAEEPVQACGLTGLGGEHVSSHGHGKTGLCGDLTTISKYRLSEQEKSLMKKCALLEAKCCQMEGRYLGVLKQLQENGSLGVQQKDLVNRLIQDELQEDMVDTIKLHPNSEYDEYGFKLIQDYDVEDMKLLAKIHALEIRSHNLLEQEAGDKQRLSRWAQYVGKRPLGELVPSPELKALLRGGVPRQYRASMWRCVVRARTQSLRERHPERYRELCGKGQASQHPAARQILLDLHRTLTSNQHFSSPSSPTLEQLHRILLAFSWQNPSIGYCQGLNRLAAIALLVLQNEEDAFWCLVAIVETIMPKDYYSKSLTASQADQRVLKELVAEKLPRLAVHFEEYGVDVSLITFNWFLVVFVEDLASKILLCVWDAFLYEGTKVLFRYALALFKYKEEDILKIHDKVEIYQYLRFFTRTISDCRKLTNIAFVHMNPFPMKLLRNRRAYHLERLEAELHELERIQEEFASESAESKDKDLSASLSDEEEDL